MKLAFITGITGQDGYYLSKLLISKKYKVFGIVRRTSELFCSSRIHPLEKDINLQYGDTSEELKKFNNKEKTDIKTIKDIDLFNDFESIAALLENLDLFITVSNSTAHLAGSLGIPTWLIKPKNHATFFYWNQNNNKTPWYNSIKIFSTKNKYEETILEIKKELIKKFRIRN